MNEQLWRLNFEVCKMEDGWYVIITQKWTRFLKSPKTMEFLEYSNYTWVPFFEDPQGGIIMA